LATNAAETGQNVHKCALFTLAKAPDALLMDYGVKNSVLVAC